MLLACFRKRMSGQNHFNPPLWQNCSCLTHIIFSMRAELLQLTEVMAKEIFCLSHFREREERLLCGPLPYQLLSLDIGDFFAFPGTLPLLSIKLSLVKIWQFTGSKIIFVSNMPMWMMLICLFSSYARAFMGYVYPSYICVWAAAINFGNGPGIQIILFLRPVSLC